MDHVNFKRDVSSHNYFSYYEKSLFCDVKLFTGGKFIPAHRIVLSEASLLFQQLLESTPDGQLSLILPIDYEILLKILEFIYKGELIVPIEALPDVITAFNYLGVKGVERHAGMLPPNFDDTAESLNESQRIDTMHFMTLEMFNQSQGSVKLDESKVVSLPLKRKRDEDPLNESASTSKMAKTGLEPPARKQSTSTKVAPKKRCKFCDKETSSTNLRIHEKSCTENPDRVVFTCQQCGILYKYSNSLKRHIKRDHQQQAAKATAKKTVKVEEKED